MLRPVPTLALFLLWCGAPARAHPGHLETLAGHDHWIAGAAIGLSIALGIWGALKGKKERQNNPVAENTEEGAAA
ncbi:MAG: DUF6732 family protein [Pseudomonadota bacterium]